MHPEYKRTGRPSFRHLVSSVVCSQHFKPDYFALHLNFKGEEEILLTSWLKRGELINI